MARTPFNPLLVSSDQGMPDSSTSKKRNTDETVYSVSAITSLIQQAIKGSIPGKILVQGEIASAKLHSSGHFYFSLRDNDAEISCVMWRSDVARLKFETDEGLDVICTGEVDVYPRSGRYQLYVKQIIPVGVGELELAFRQTFEKLKNKGYFDPEHKKDLPLFPERIGVVTSRTGAAVKDIINTLQRRYPLAEIILSPCKVQGENASADIIRAIKLIEKYNRCNEKIDAMIVGRGGGSQEDLWAFNDEKLAITIFKSKVPIVSAVGHEIDVSISDYVADVRAATPTAAAELISPDVEEIRVGLASLGRMMTYKVDNKLASNSEKFSSLVNRTWFVSPDRMIHQYMQTLDLILSRIDKLIHYSVHNARHELHEYANMLQQISPGVSLLQAEMKLKQKFDRIQNLLASKYQHDRERIQRVSQFIQLFQPDQIISRFSEKLQYRAHLLNKSLRHAIDLQSLQVESVEKNLTIMGYKNTLSRGYSVTTSKKSGNIVRDAESVTDDDVIVTETANGKMESRVINQSQKELFD